ncbi:MAG: site-specific integrase [Eubacteriales bacterium]|nr:site-specific integrase [Eubacteriales bacterium]
MPKYKKRADGRYCKQILVGYKPDGKRKMKTIYGKTIKEVENKEREIRDSIECGTRLIQDDITLKEWGTKWLKVYKTKTSASTYASYENCLRNHIIPTIGHIPLTKLKPIQIQTSLNNLIDKGKVRMAELYKLTIKQIVNQAVEEGIIAKSVCNCLDTIKSQREEKRVLSDFELKCIARTKYTDKEKMFLDILYYTGIRRGEALALKVNDFDKENRTIKISKSLDIRENTPKLKEPKTKSGYREIPVPDILFNELVEYTTKQNAIYLFTMNDGRLVSRSSFRKMWDSIIKKTKLTASLLEEKADEFEGLKVISDETISFTPHTFRHTYATNLYYANMDIKRTQYLLGHSTLDMTLRTYTHLQNKNNTETANRINEFFSQSKFSQTAI